MKKTRMLLVACLCAACMVSCASKPEKQLAMAEAKFAAGDFSAAIELVEGLIAQHPSDGVIPEAKALLEAATEQQILQKADTLLADAKAAYAAGQYAEATRKANTYLKSYASFAGAKEAEQLIRDVENAVLLQKASALLESIKADLDAGNYAAVMRRDGAVAEIAPDSEYAKIAKEYTAQAILGDLREKLDTGDYTYVLGQKIAISTIDPESPYAETAREYVAEAQNMQKADMLTELETAYDRADWKKVQTLAKKLLSMFPECEEGETVQGYADMAAQMLADTAAAEIRAVFRVTELSVSEPDSTGGVQVYFNFVNHADKVIDFVHFGFTFYNALGEVVTCESKPETVNRCYKAGPYAKGEGLTDRSWSWGKYYNRDIALAELKSLSIEYADGSVLTLTAEQIEYVQD